MIDDNVVCFEFSCSTFLIRFMISTLGQKKKSWMLKIIKINRFKCMFNNSNNNKRWKFFERFNSLFFYLNSQYEKGKNFSLYNSICASILFGYKIDLRTFFSYDRLILCILCYYYLDRIFFFVLTLSIWSGGMECRFFCCCKVSTNSFVDHYPNRGYIHSFENIITRKMYEWMINNTLECIWCKYHFHIVNPKRTHYPIELNNENKSSQTNEWTIQKLFTVRRW